MSNVQVIPVRNQREKEMFIKCPWRIYKNDPIWVPPLLPERRKLLDPKQGPFFKHGQLECAIAWREGEPVGTICAAEDWELNEGRGLKDCIFGFFECLDDETVARALFDYAHDWADTHHLTALYGPFNLDYEDGYGVLIEGRQRPAAILCGHSTPYYQKFFEDYGFIPARGDNLAFGLELKQTPELLQLSEMAERVRRRHNFVVRTARFDEFEQEVDRILPLINAALAHLDDYRPWPRETLRNLFLPFRDLANPDLILIIEDKGKVIGFFPGMPNFNQTLIHANGLRYPWNYVSLLWQSRQKPNELSIKSILVYPEYWGTGVAILMFAEMARRAMSLGYRWVDLSLTSADNPRTPALATRFGAHIYKRFRVYRLNF
jgi:GNAT superfamily N-acetyltransferase